MVSGKETKREAGIRLTAAGLACCLVFNGWAAGVELLVNRGFEDLVAVKQVPDKWSFPGATLPAGWEPVAVMPSTEVSAVQSSGVLV